MAVSGNVTISTGEEADYVRVFEWPNGPAKGIAIPDSNGDWSFEVATSGEYGITYIGHGCQPVTHGPYIVQGAPKVLEYQNASELTHDWADLSGWSYDRVYVSNNRLYGGSYGNPKAAGKAFTIQPSDQGKFVSEFYETSSSNGTRYIGMNFGGANNGVLASLPNFIGIGMSADLSPVVWVGENFTGPIASGNTYIDASVTLGPGHYRVTAAVDSENISLTLQGESVSEEFYFVIPRGYAPNNGEVTSVIVWNGSSQGESGSYVGGCGAKQSLTPFRDAPFSGGTSKSTIYRDVSDLWRIQFPETMDGNSRTPVVVFFHQAVTGSATSPISEQRMIPVTDALSKSGFILASANDGGDRWGNQASIDNYRELISWIKTSSFCGPILLLGVSGGSLTAINLALKDDQGDIAGVALVSPVCDIFSIYTDPTFTDSINQAYSAGSQSELEVNADGYNPVSAPAGDSAGIGFRFYVSEAADDVVSITENAVAFKNLIQGIAAESELLSAGSGHLSDEQYQPEDLIEFFNRCIKRWIWK